MGCNSKRIIRFWGVEKNFEVMGGLVDEYIIIMLLDFSIDEICRIYVCCDCILW